MRLRVLGIAAVAAACVFLVACGSSSDAPTVTTVAVDDRPPTKAEFIKAADAICLENNRKIERLNAKLADAKDAAEFSGDGEEVATIYREVIPIVEAGVEELRGITPPPPTLRSITATFDRSSSRSHFSKRWLGQLTPKTLRR